MMGRGKKVGGNQAASRAISCAKTNAEAGASCRLHKFHIGVSSSGEMVKDKVLVTPRSVLGRDGRFSQRR